MKISYISSTDGEMPPNHTETVERTMAIKKFRPGYNPKRDKITH